ncbi:MAG: hypothetical protein IJY92_04815 [Alphaproteobacteria bacterium]|nr:hypothetical protein [Alphaproteobacteria bacterium]
MKMYKKFLFLLVCLFLTATGYATDSFLTKTSDVPLMDGLIVRSTNQMDFDTPTGQVLSLEAISKNKTGDDVIKFYESVLPQMGWKIEEKGSFSRQSDTLNIVILKNKKPSKMRFDIFLTNGQ